MSSTIKKENSTSSSSPSTSLLPPKHSSSLSFTFPKKPSTNKTGETLHLLSNYFPFIFTDSSKTCFFKYSITFTPEIPEDSTSLRKKIFNKLRDAITTEYGNFFFNNTTLYCSEHRNSEKAFEVEFNSQTYVILIKWASYIEANSIEALPIYKRFFYSLLGKMSFIQFKRNYFEKSSTNRVQDVEIWPGFNPSINICQSSILVNINTLSKVIRGETAWMLLKKLQNKYNQSQLAFQTQAKEEFKNISVLTRYNNDKTFTIETVDFTKNPQHTFDTTKGPVSFIDYYKMKYNKDIKDRNQPLLVSVDKKTKKSIYLIPEFCLLTGLTDEIRSNFNLMKQISEYTIGQAHKKMTECLELVSKLTTHDKCKELINKWGITISPQPTTITGRKLNPGDICMKRVSIPLSTTHDLDRKVQTEMFNSPKLEKWIIFYNQASTKVVNGQFLSELQSAFNTFHFPVQNPKVIAVNSTKSEDWKNTIQSNVTNDTQIVLIVMPGNRGKGFFYNELKLYLTCQLGIPSQVILEGTVRKERGLRSVVNKLLIQICAKIGGEPWVFKDIPCSKEPTMLLAFTTYKNILTCCGTYNKSFTQYFSKSTLLDEHNQLGAGTKVEEVMKSMIMQFNAKWRCFPRKLIVFREGVQSNMVEQFYSEIKSIKKVIKDLNMAVEAKLAYVVMNKKHNLKTVLVNNNNQNKYFNIPSGTLIDDVVVGDDYEFYLVSQSSNQGISQAMHYKIMFDEIELKPEDVHLLVYKMCFLYYNWTGGIKTPAPAHYAKKLAYLVGDKLSSKGHVELPNQKIEGLYFL